MRTTKRFSKEFKEAIGKKLISRGNKTIERFCNENNVALSSVSRWQSECVNVLGMKSKKNKSKYSAEEILKVVRPNVLRNSAFLRYQNISIFCAKICAAEINLDL